jgi:hypothetical protein
MPLENRNAVIYGVGRSAGSPDAPDVLETFEHHAAAGGTTP